MYVVIAGAPTNVNKIGTYKKLPSDINFQKPQSCMHFHFSSPSSHARFLPFWNLTGVSQMLRIRRWAVHFALMISGIKLVFGQLCASECTHSPGLKSKTERAFSSILMKSWQVQGCIY